MSCTLCFWPLLLHPPFVSVLICWRWWRDDHRARAGFLFVKKHTRSHVHSLYCPSSVCQNPAWIQLRSWTHVGSVHHDGVYTAISMQMSQGGLQRLEHCRGKASNCDYMKSSDRNRWPDAMEETACIQSRYLGSLRADFLHLSLNDLSEEKKKKGGGGFQGWCVGCLRRCRHRGER